LKRALEDAPFLDAPLVRKIQDLKQGIKEKRSPEAKEEAKEQAKAEKREAEKRAKLRSLVLEGKRALESGHTDVGRKRLEEAMTIAHTTSGGQKIEADIADLLHEQQEDEDEDEATVDLEIGIGGGFDSNVPQSGVVVVAPTQQDRANPAAALVAVDVDFAWRAVETGPYSLTLGYVMSEVAYASETVDQFSIQDHTVKMTAGYTPRRWISLEALGEVFLLFSGTKSFAPFQAGAGMGPQVVLRETDDFETSLKYTHVFKQSLQDTYAFLSGGRDEATIAQAWKTGPVELTLSYVLRNEAIGVERAPVLDIVSPEAAVRTSTVFGARAVYNIPYSFLGHEASMNLHLKLPWKLDVAAAFAYEHRTYNDPSYITNPATGLGASYFRNRVDDRYTVRTALGRDLWDKFAIELSYTFIANRSTIDPTNPLSFFDYDNKNYAKHLFEVIVSYRY
jgi:hypothetical protein